MRGILMLTMVLIVSGSSFIYSQSGSTFSYLHPTPQGNLLRWVCVLDSLNFVAGGNSGTFIRTTDGGQTWMTRFDATRSASTGVYAPANSGYFFDQDNGVLCGTWGATLTTNGGLSFDTTTTVFPSGITWYNIRFVSRSVGYMAGTYSGRMAKTTDGGRNWTLNTTLPSATYYGVFPLSESRIVIVSSYSSSANVRLTTDGGSTWIASAAGTGTLNCVAFADSLHGYIGGSNGQSYRTTDGGQIWSAMNTGAPATLLFNSVLCHNGVVYLSGSASTIYRSTDMGATFSAMNCGDPSQLLNGTITALGINGQTMVAVGDYGIVNVSRDNGATWQTKWIGTKGGQNYQLYMNRTTRRMIAAGGQTYGISSPDNIIISTDFGNTWKAVTSLQTSATFRSLFMLTPDTGYAGGTNGMLYKTTNGGVSWDLMQTNISSIITCAVIQFADQLHGWIFGNNGYILRTTDSGTNWSYFRPDTVTFFNGAQMMNANLGYAVGSGGKMYKTNDGWSTWTTMNSGLTNTLYTIVMTNNNTGYISASNGMILKTTDGGNTWPSMNLGTTTSLYALDVWDVNNIAVGGGTGFYFRTTDGGTTWIRSVNGGGSLQALKFISRDTVIVAGSSGSIIRHVTPGSAPVNCTDVQISSGWNLLSVPRSAPIMTATALYPTKTSPPYFYSNGYISNDTLTVGRGFWLRFANSQIVTICGNTVASTTVPLSAGWNIIGGYEKNVPVAGITTTPAGILTSSFFSYDNGYIITDILIPGKGYWVRSSQNGVMNLNTSTLSRGNDIESILANLAPLTLTDNSGNKGRLYFSAEPIPEEFRDLPPVPPAGVFDVRFSDNTMISSSSNDSRFININSAEFPITLKAEGISLQISDMIGGKIFKKELRAGEAIVIFDPQLTTLSVTPITRTYTFELMQNYPNPFNPTTTISYQIPKNEFVSLIVYDALGREVKTLVNEAKTQGIYSAEFNASNLPSGVYFYTLKTEDYFAIKKMLLLK